jgi:ribose 1,5-bisphosphokinase
VADREIDVSRFAPGVSGVSRGRLIGVVGPSGAGKDSVMEALVARMPDLHRARRVITRPEDRRGRGVRRHHARALRGAGSGGGFRAALEGPWAELRGAGKRVREVLGTGRDALVNLSRSVLGKARLRQFETFLVLHVTARPEVLAERLATRAAARPRRTSRAVSRARRRQFPAGSQGGRDRQFRVAWRMRSTPRWPALYPARV